MDHDSFDEEQYKHRLIEMGMAEDVAAAVAANRSRLLPKSQRSGHKRVTEVVATQPTANMKAQAEPKPSTPCAPRVQKANRESAALRPRKSSRREPLEIPTQPESPMFNAVGSSISIAEKQMSLFEIAPWEDHMRGMPNDIARTALFTVRNKSVKREVLQQQPIYSYNNDVTITFSGIELRAEDDELVWQQVLEYAKRFPLGRPITFTFYQLCKDLGWSINGRYYKKAEESLTRLQASALQYHSSKVGSMVSLSLLRRFGILDKGKRTSRCQVELEDEMVLLFAGGNYSKIVWEKYRQLKPTARRLFDYVVSHRNPYPLSLERFNMMCASDSDRPNRWRDQVRKACAELKESGLVEDSYVNGDLIYNKRGRPGWIEESSAIEGAKE